MHIITYDVGTTGMKTCLFAVDSQLHLLSSAVGDYDLILSEKGGAEQDPEQWWQAMKATTASILQQTGLSPTAIAGISFCSQMQGLVLVDKEGKAVRNAFSYMDQRATEEKRKGISYGLQIAGANVFKLLTSIAITGAVAVSVKDPIWKYQWVKHHEPQVFGRVYKWLDVKEYLIARLTGRFVMTEDSAFATLLYDIRNGRHCWSRRMCRMLDVDMHHLPEIVAATDRVGTIKQAVAEELGLSPETPVFGGGGDAAVTGLGAGAVQPGDSYIYMGTSGWLSTVVKKSIVDPFTMTAAIVSSIPGRFNYFSELETAGKCLEWVRDHLALDEIHIYLDKQKVTDSSEAVYTNLYEYMSSVIADIPAGSGGVVFTPWLRGNRCPFEDANARGMFFNIGLDTGKTELIRAVTEGVCLHMRWFLEVQQKKVKTSPTIRFVGGGALSDVTCQILSDCLGRPVETIDHPQNVGAIGAAIIVAVGLGQLNSLDEAPKAIPVRRTFTPDRNNTRIYDRNFAVFKHLYTANRKNFSALNALPTGGKPWNHETGQN